MDKMKTCIGRKAKTSLDWFFTKQSALEWLQCSANLSKCGFVHFLQKSRTDLDPHWHGSSHVETSREHHCLINSYWTHYVNSKVDFFHFAMDLKTNTQNKITLLGYVFGMNLDEHPWFYGSILNIYMQITRL